MRLRAGVAGALAGALLLAACSPSSPEGSTPDGSGSGPAGPDSPYASAEAFEALADPSWERLADVGEALDEAVDTETGLVEALGPELVDWLTDQRSEAIAAAAAPADIDLTDLAPALLPGEPVAMAGPMTAFGAEAWIGSSLLSGFGLDAWIGRIGEQNEVSTEPRELRQERTDGDLHTVSTTRVTFNVSVAGSRVISEADATQDVTSTNTQTGQVIATSAFRSHIRAEINACPNVDGVATLQMQIDMSSQTSGQLGTVSWEAHSESQEDGQVGEDANLQTETSVTDMEFTTTSSDGTTRTGSISVTLTTARGANGRGFNGVTSVEGTESGSMSGEERIRWMRFMHLTSLIVSSRGFDKAQEQWKSGKCVRIEATESSRFVDPQEVVTFTAEPWHRIDGDRLNKRIVATLAGVASVEPEGAAQDPPATIVYRAGTEAGDTGTVTLTSTSNRGIGTATITFTVRVAYRIDGTRNNNEGATGTVHGEKCDGIDGEWILDGTYTAAGFYNGTQQWVITVTEATMTGTFTYTDLQVGMFPGVPRTEGQAAGTVTVTEDEEGDVHMHLVETSHSFRTETTAPAGGWGNDQNAPLEEYDYVWEQGDPC